MDYRTKDTVTSVKDQEEIATTFCVHAVSRITAQVVLHRNPALIVSFSNAVFMDKISLYDESDGKYLVEHFDHLSIKQWGQ